MGSSNLGKSFEHAIEGIAEAIVSERNLRIHFIVGIGVSVLSFVLPLAKEDFLWILFAIFFVIWSELINTVIEYLMNLYSEEFHPVIKIIKDVSAGVVLWSVIFAVTVGVVVLGELVFGWTVEVGKILATIALVFFPIISIRVVKKWKKR